MSDPTDGWPGRDWPSHEWPSHERPAEERPSGEWPSEDWPSEDWPAGDRPAEERPSGEWPSEDWPAGDRPAEEWPSGDWPPDDRPAGRGRHGRARASDGQRSLLVRYRWYGALLAGVAAAALATGAIILMNSHDGRLVANGCGMVSCSAALPGGTSASALPQGSPRGTLTARPAAHHRNTATPTSSPSASPSARAAGERSPSPPPPSPSPSPTASASPTPTQVDATVTYTVDQRWPGGFQGHFTIVNNGTEALSGWALTATLPGDKINSVWSANYSVDGNQLTLTAPDGQPAIAPGASQSAYFTASGSTVKPTGCVFNSQTCSG
jgi:hypothetical protein